MMSLCPLSRLSFMVDFKPFLPVCCVAICLMADCLNGSQPSDLRLALGLLVRQFSLFKLLTAFSMGFVDGLNDLAMRCKYRTLYHIGIDFGVHESLASRIAHKVEDVLINSGHFELPKKLPSRTDNDIN